MNVIQTHLPCRYTTQKQQGIREEVNIERKKKERVQGGSMRVHQKFLSGKSTFINSYKNLGKIVMECCIITPPVILAQLYLNNRDLISPEGGALMLFLLQLKKILECRDKRIETMKISVDDLNHKNSQTTVKSITYLTASLLCPSTVEDVDLSIFRLLTLTRTKGTNIMTYLIRDTVY